MSENITQHHIPLGDLGGGDLSGGKPGTPVNLKHFNSGYSGGSVGGSDGKGGGPSLPDVKVCSKCGGDGKKRVLFVVKSDEPCPKCGGSGYC